MAEHFADCCDVCAGCQLVGCEGVTEAVEADVLLDSCVIYPFSECFSVERVSAEFWEYIFAIFSSAAHQFYGLLGNRESHDASGLSHCEVEVVAFAWLMLQLFPCECLDVSEAESGQ